MKEFNEEHARLEAGYKTGWFGTMLNEEEKALAVKHNCDCLGAGTIRIHWYLTRSENRHPVIKVEYHFPTYAPRRVPCGGGFTTMKKIWRCTTKSAAFPFSPEGLEAAKRYAESL